MKTGWLELRTGEVCKLASPLGVELAEEAMVNAGVIEFIVDVEDI